MSFVVNIDEFEGPLDLMLFLIRENKLDLFDLDLVTLTNQYISFIHRAVDQQLVVASEYLSEMASLIELKSRRLLPRPTTINSGEPDGDAVAFFLKNILNSLVIKTIGTADRPDIFLELNRHISCCNL